MKSICRTWVSRIAAALYLCAGLPHAASQGLTPLSYSTYFGGNDTDVASAVAVDSAGNVYVTGWTASTSLPVKTAFQSSSGGGVDAFVAKFDSLGRLTYCTYLGGLGDDRGFGIAVDNGGNAYVTGWTSSPNFPVAGNSAQGRLAAGLDVFVAKLGPAGDHLVYSTYLGGSGSDEGRGIALDAFGNAYIAGQTGSANFPTLNAVQSTLRGLQNAFVAGVDANGALRFSTYLGGSGTDGAAAIAVDSQGGIYLTGSTDSPNFPTLNPFQPVSGGYQDAFVTKLNPNGAGLAFSTYLGGTGGSAVDYPEAGLAIDVDATGSAYVTGVTSSTNFPVQHALQPSLAGWVDTFVTRFSPTGAALQYSTYLGGVNLDYGSSIRVDGAGNACVAGYTTSADFPQVNPVQTTLAGSYDAFLFCLNAPGDSLISSTLLGGTQSDAALGLALGGGFAHVAGETLSGNFPMRNQYQSVLLGEVDAFIAKIPIPCTYVINPVGASASAAGGAGFVSLVAPAGCAWTAVSNAPSWLAITSSASGSGGATVTYSAAANPGNSPRVGSLSIGGRSFSVTQAAGCTYSLTPSSSSIGYAGGDSLTFGIVTSAGNCAWSVLTPVNWLKALPDSGSGNGTITYSVYPNYSGLARSAALAAGGQNFTIVQTGAPGSSNERFVQLLYFNFYGRRPSPSEISFQVINGVGPQGRAQVALNFFNGTEFLNGGRYIAGLYFGLLGRAPDYNGWLFQRNAMARNIVDPIGLIANFLNGAEFQQKYGPLSDAAFVTLLYNQILLRPPDPGGLTAQVNGIRLYGRAQIAYNMLSSPEFQVTTGPRMSAFLLYACLLQRDASATETSALVSQIQQGATFLSLISNFISTGEFGLMLQ